MSQKDFYQVLGVERSASDADIKKAYRKLAMKYHPDRNPDDKNAEERFKEVQKAYDILSDREKRQAYDQYGHAGVDPQAAYSSRGARGGAGFGGFSDIFGDMFGDIFGGGTRQGNSRQVYRGSDLRYDLEITLEEAARGCEKQIQIPSVDTCTSCKGSGAREGSQPTTCSSCGGSGQIEIQNGFFSIRQTCPHCHGVGKVITDPCPSCHGTGHVKKQKNLNVKIPAGVDKGDRVRLSGEGSPGTNGGPRGDLFVVINIAPHPVFQRDGQDLHCEMPIYFTTAALGGEFEIPTLDGSVKLKIPAETQSGQVFRLRGKGIRAVRGASMGDLFCHVMIETPVNLTERQKELLREFDAVSQSDFARHHPKSKTFFDRVRDFFN